MVTEKLWNLMLTEKCLHYHKFCYPFGANLPRKKLELSL